MATTTEPRVAMIALAQIRHDKNVRGTLADTEVEALAVVDPTDLTVARFFDNHGVTRRSIPVDDLASHARDGGVWASAAARA